MFLRKCLCALAALSVLLLPLQGRAAPIYTVTFFPAGFEPDGINNRGQVAGTLRLENGAEHAALFSSGIVTDLSVFEGSYSVGRALNDPEAMTGSALTASGESHGLLYRNGRLTDLGPGTKRPASMPGATSSGKSSMPAASTACSTPMAS